MIGTYYVVVAGIVNDKLIIIFRGDGYRQDCGAIAQSACGLIGQGGGHRSAARIEIPLDVLKAELKGNLSQQSIDHFLNQCLKKSGMNKPDPSAVKTEEDKT
jgi:nanoRNase/pAp phosphatase (c-di-AMP/oligoRNAs hydrolase)